MMSGLTERGGIYIYIYIYIYIISNLQKEIYQKIKYESSG